MKRSSLSGGYALTFLALKIENAQIALGACVISLGCMSGFGAMCGTVLHTSIMKVR